MNMVDFSLKNKVAIITGGTGILGQTFSRGLCEAGANLIVVDKIGEPELFAKELASEYGVKTKGFTCELRSQAAVKSLVSEVVKEFGRIDILHNNAAGKGDDLAEYLKPFEIYSLEKWQEIMSINVDTMFLMAQAVGNEMLKTGGGSIIQTASIYGVVAPDKRIYEGSLYNNHTISSPAVYSASKAAVIGLSNYLAAYWGDKNIRVNTLTPGGVHSGQNETFFQKYSARVPMGRMAEKKDMVGALIYLASDMSKYVTGQNILVDGGLTVW